LLSIACNNCTWNHGLRARRDGIAQSLQRVLVAG